MRICKFGGTCLTDINIAKIADVVDDSCPVVVVSAVGAQHANDSKVTQQLIALHSALPAIDIWQTIASRYRQIVAQHHIDIDIEGLLDSTISDIVLHDNYHYTISVGEQLSAKVMAKYLGRQYLEAQNVIHFDDSGNLLLDQSCSSIASAVCAGGLYVMGGFYGGSCNGNRMTFGRGGSDISGAVVARALCADIYENWTDVCGLCHADPKLVDCVGTVRCLSYDNMQLLADCGVGVLNNHSIYPVRDVGIPISIRSIYNRHDSGTLVCRQQYDGQLLSLLQSYTCAQYITTIISTHSCQHILDMVSCCASRLSIDYHIRQCTANVVQIITSQSVIAPLYRQLVD